MTRQMSGNLPLAATPLICPEHYQYYDPYPRSQLSTLPANVVVPVGAPQRTRPARETCSALRCSPLRVGRQARVTLTSADTVTDGVVPCLHDPHVGVRHTAGVRHNLNKGLADRSVAQRGRGLPTRILRPARAASAGALLVWLGPTYSPGCR